MQMRDELPAGDSPEYRSILPDGLTLFGVSVDPDWYYNMNAYIVTNSGSKDPSNWIHGWDNVWTNTGFVNSWTTGICQGAWDTFLAIPDIWPNPPTQNSEAFFPDGRYAVRVTAVSHGSRDTGIDTLPVDDLSLRDPQVEGVVVDNFLPHIVRVAAYTWNPAADTCYKIYAGYWEDIDPSRQSMAEPEYPEQLRSELCALQSSNQIDALQSRYVFDLPESFSRSSIDHDYQAERNRLSRDNSDGTGYFEPGCCLDEGIGQDPVEFLLEEIARVENQQVFNVDTTRTFDYRVYGYLPMNVGNLVLQVFYSEPIMSDNFNQEEIPDNLYFTGTIGNLIKWTSLAHGEFERLPGSFQLPLTSDTTTNCDMEFDNTFFDSSYVVHYIFRGALPREYVGNIHLYIGNPDQRIGGSPRDLAGNALDSYPGTVAEPRSDYGQFSYTGFELGPDTNYFMYDPPDWKAIPQGSSPDSVIGLVGEDTIAVIHPAEIGLEDAWFIGDCDYWCGFWMYREVPDEYGFNVYVVKPDGSYIDHSFKTPYPVGGISYEENWFSFPGRLSPDSRYFWMTGCTINLISERSCALAYCVDSKTGARIDDHPVCSGPCFWGPRSTICHSTAEIVDIDSDAVAEISYSYFKTLYNPDSGVEGTTYISPPGGSDANLSEDMCCTSYISSDAEEVIEILSNPVRETLGVRLVGEYGENYELLLYDISGRQILSESGILRDDESVLSVGVQNLPSGVYLLRIRTGDIEVVRTVSIIH